MAQSDILLLGDGSHLFRTIAWVLEYKGYTVRATASPEAALEALVKKNYDLVIARLTAQESDGLDVLRRAKRLNPDIKVMVVSGIHDMTLPMEAYQIEVDDYLLMPVSPTELWRRVSQCLDRQEVVDLKAVRIRTRPHAEFNELALNRLMIMFHDIRSAMVSTAAGLKLLTRGTYGEVSDKAAAKLQEVSARVDQLINLTEEFMGSAFADDGQGRARKEILDLQQDIVSPVLAELGEEIKAQQITLENRLHHYAGGAIPVKGSKPWLMSVFRNLVNNGIKYGGQGCTIVIEWEKQGSNGRLNVYNSGQPIPEENRTLLFSNHRLKSRRAKGSGSGMGIGLYLSRDVVNSYGGDLWYEPKSSGSQFVVSLPQN